MTGDHIIYAYARFLGVLPTAEEILHAAKHFTTEFRHNCYLYLDPRIFSEPKGQRKNLLCYSSCHCDQIIAYLIKYRQDVLNEYYVHMLFTHRMSIERPHSNNRFMHALFSNADMVIWNVLGEKFHEQSTDVLGRLLKPDVKVVSFVPPSCACWWPVCEHYGEEPVTMLIEDGKDVKQIIDIYRAGTMDYGYDARFPLQIERLKHRERNRDVKISRYIMRHYKTHRCFHTYNHPSFHLMAYVVDECLGHLGFKQLGEDHSLTVGVNEANFGNHYPDHQSMWDFYGFTFPMDLTRERGGADIYYPQTIKEIAARFAARNNQPAFVDIEDDY